MLALSCGAIHLALAASPSTRFRSHLFALHYAEGAVFGARYVVMLAGLTLVLLARPLLHGKRTAWWLALTAAAGSIPGHHIRHGDLLGVASSGALIVVLVLTRRAFRVRSDPARARQGWQLIAGGLTVVLVYAIVGMTLLDRSFDRSATIDASVVDGFRLLLLLPASAVTPITRHGQWFVDSVRIATLAVIFAGVVRLVATTVLRRGRSDEDERAVRSLLERYGTTPLAHFQLLDDKVWFVSRNRDAFVGYKLVGRCAVVLGGPIGADAARATLLSEFLEFCDANGWIPAFHQVTPAELPTLLDAGLLPLKIGEEPIVPVQEWSIDDHRYKSLRSALRRVERAGYRVVELPTPISAADMAQLREVSELWLARDGHRERTFTLGQFDPAELNATTVLAVIDGENRIRAFANVLPSYRSNVGNFDLMRRDPTAVNGVMELLFVALIERFKREGRTGMTLGLAPLAGVDGDTLPDRALRALYERGEQVFNFRGLAAFKEKWQPEHEDRWLCYQTTADLPRIAAAVARAGELPDPRRLPVRAVALIGRYPFTTALFGVVFWFMLSTHVEPQTHVLLMRQLALRGSDLLHLQVWRLGTSQVVQTKSGFAWGNIALLLPIVPLAEHRLGSKRTIILFAICDWISTLVVLAGLKVLAVLGDTTAARDLLARDAGSSSGAWALATGVAIGLPAGRWRKAALTGILGFNIGAGLIQRELVDAQHGLAITAAFAVTWLLDARRKRREASAVASTSDARGVTSETR